MKNVAPQKNCTKSAAKNQKPANAAVLETPQAAAQAFLEIWQDILRCKDVDTAQLKSKTPERGGD